MKYCSAAKAWALIMILSICCIDSEGAWMYVPAAISVISAGMVCLNMMRFEKSAEARERGRINQAKRMMHQLEEIEEELKRRKVS